MNTYSIQTRNQLNNEELGSIKQLAETCNEYDQIQLKLNWEMLQERGGKESNDYLVYENEQLIGFFAMYSFRSTEVEVSGMVHPEHRRKGIFRHIVKRLKEESVNRDIPKIIFICQHGSLSGKAALESLGAQYSFSEYWMRLEEDALRANGESTSAVTIRVAEPKDDETIIHLIRGGFDMAEADARKYVEKNRSSPAKQTLLAQLRQENGNVIPVGKIAFRQDENKAFIFGFCVMADLRGKGYGKVILSETVAAIKARNERASIELEVAVDNERALGLYESCGFRVSNANDYYDLASE